MPRPTTEIPSLPTVPIPNGSFPFLSYTKGNPLAMWWSLKNVRVSLILSIPPDSDINLPSKSNSLFLFDKIGSNVAPDPLPPSIVNDKTSWISKSCGSTWISTTLPEITGRTSAVVLPVPGELTCKIGGFITS